MNIRYILGTLFRPRFNWVEVIGFIVGHAVSQQFEGWYQHLVFLVIFMPCVIYSAILHQRVMREFKRSVLVINDKREEQE